MFTGNPANPATAAPTAPIREFATAEDAARAGLAPGTKITVGGKPGTWK